MPKDYWTELLQIPCPARLVMTDFNNLDDPVIQNGVATKEDAICDSYKKNLTLEQDSHQK